jgi:hypothetical protein
MGGIFLEKSQAAHHGAFPIDRILHPHSSHSVVLHLIPNQLVWVEFGGIGRQEK